MFEQRTRGAARNTSTDQHRYAPSRSLQLLLWTLWTLGVVATAAFHWYQEIAVGQPVDLVRLVIRTTLVGVIGLIIMTKVELSSEPWRFLD